VTAGNRFFGVLEVSHHSSNSFEIAMLCFKAHAPGAY